MKNLSLKKWAVLSADIYKPKYTRNDLLLKVIIILIKKIVNHPESD